MARLRRKKRRNEEGRIILYDGRVDDGRGRIVETNRGYEKVNPVPYATRQEVSGASYTKAANEEYWRRREADHRNATIRRVNGYEEEIKDIYYRMIRNTQTEIDAFYQRYASKEGITMAEAKQRVSQLDIKEYEAKAKRYIEMARKKDEGAFSEEADAEMRLYNLTMKVNRLEMLKSEIGLELVSDFNELQQFFDEKLTDETLQEFERQAGILGETIITNAERASAIVNDSYQHATFSERLWDHQTALKAEIGRALEKAIIGGRGSREVARDIRKIFNTSQYNAERLMRTEIRRCQTEAAKESMTKNGNEEYEYMALGRNPCPVCSGLNGRIFKVSDMLPGVNAPPMHPFCMCATSPHWDETKYQRWLDSGAARAGIEFKDFQ